MSFPPEVGSDPWPSFVKSGEVNSTEQMSILRCLNVGKLARQLSLPITEDLLAVPLDTMMKITLALVPTMVKRCYKLN